MSKLSSAGVAALAKVRARLAAWPDVEETLSHGAPAWFVAKRQIAVLTDDHHGDGRLALWCAAPEGAQAMLVDSEPDHYFVPPYVGTRGWVGVRLDRGLAWSEVAGALERARDTILAKTGKATRAKRPTAPTPTRTKEARAARAKAATIAPPRLRK